VIPDLKYSSPSASGGTPDAVAEAPVNPAGCGRDQPESVSIHAQRTSSSPEAAEAVPAVAISMIVPQFMQLSTRDAVLLEITQMRADLEYHAARRASLHAETTAAGALVQSTGRIAVPSEGSLPESMQMQRGGRMEQAAGSDADPMPMEESQPLPCAAPQQQAHEAAPSPLAVADRSEELQGSGRRASWSESEQQEHGFALQWAQLPPPPRRLSTQPSAPLRLARSSSLPAQLGPAVPHTPISWAAALPPLHQQSAALSTSQRFSQSGTRRLTGDGRSGLPPIMSAPLAGRSSARRPVSAARSEQDLHRQEAVPSLPPVRDAVAGQGQPMLASQPLRVLSPCGLQTPIMPDITAPVGHRQRARLRSDAGECERIRQPFVAISKHMSIAVVIYVPGCLDQDR